MAVQMPVFHLVQPSQDFLGLDSGLASPPSLMKSELLLETTFRNALMHRETLQDAPCKVKAGLALKAESQKPFSDILRLLYKERAESRRPEGKCAGIDLSPEPSPVSVPHGQALLRGDKVNSSRRIL